MSVNFREAQKANVRKTWMLATALTLLLVLCGYAFGYGLWGTQQAAYVGIAIGGGVAVVMTLFAVFGGSAAVLGIARAREVGAEGKPMDLDEQKLRNVVEEMALASGLPMPRVFIIESKAPNAFACGRNPKEACVAVTRGLLEQLTRDELQAVVAHEMGHIRNYDILYTVVVAILVGVIVMLADMFIRSLWWGGGRRGGGDRDNGQIVWLVIGIALAILAPLFAMMLQYAVSRQREYLADATAVELTRNPMSLVHALQKIAGGVHLGGGPMQNRGTAHLYIYNPIKGAAGQQESVFATHPPIQKRIERLQAMAGEYANNDGANG